MTADTWFVAGLMLTVSTVWGALAYPAIRIRLPKIYFIARSWWWMLAILCSCYVIAKIDLHGQHPYAWLLTVFFLLVGLRALYEIIRLWRPHSKARLVYKLQQRGLQPPILLASNQPTLTLPSANKLFYTRQINDIDIALALATISLTVSLIVLQHVAWQRSEYGVLLFVLFSSQFNDIAQYLCGKWLKNKLFKRNLAPTISPNKSIEGALFGGVAAAVLATIFGIWLTPFSSWVCFFAAYGLVIGGIAGDLLESAFKRQHGIKDVGTMLAGHGGVLDRIDSLLIGVPLFTLVYWFY
ncbi:phosphatidate cytidylyltransferase [Psychrobacter sp. JB385]|uniref:phosphatidate cytidylyltransferase n=1 Tax=Psychrobacter sp. JB385 TaxID=1434841 RepID=UPI00097ED960|nr:phosphatidate cytidylyltransferase [Psychrobacter sp. JB385]SJN33043.1 Phosphatidate cytidylyltransferase [Psychrobacter sp. JB385]